MNSAPPETLAARAYLNARGRCPVGHRGPPTTLEFVAALRYLGANVAAAEARRMADAEGFVLSDWSPSK